MSEKKVLLTYNGLKKLEDELQELKTVRRKDVAEKIKEARGQGDLSENAEYDSAKEEQAEIEARIATIEKMLRNVDIIDEEDVDTEKVSLGSRVTLLEIDSDEEMVYYIVGSAESDPMNGKISNESPLGTAIIGAKVGESITVNVPDGEISIKILEIAH